MADKRITDVDFLDSLNSDESFFVNQNNTLKQVKRSNVTFEIINGGTGAKDAETARANLGAADSETVDEIGVLLSNLRNDFDSYTNSVDSIISEMQNAVTPISNGGTGSSDGAEGLKNLFASGYTILSPYQYGTELPEAGIEGRIFFKIIEEETNTANTSE